MLACASLDSIKFNSIQVQSLWCALLDSIQLKLILIEIVVMFLLRFDSIRFDWMAGVTVVELRR